MEKCHARPTSEDRQFCSFFKLVRILPNILGVIAMRNSGNKCGLLLGFGFLAAGWIDRALAENCWDLVENKVLCSQSQNVSSCSSQPCNSVQSCATFQSKVYTGNSVWDIVTPGSKYVGDPNSSETALCWTEMACQASTVLNRRCPETAGSSCTSLDAQGLTCDTCAPAGSPMPQSFQFPTGAKLCPPY